MSDPNTFRCIPDIPHVAHERIDGEVVILHFATGTYFSLRGSGAVLWELLPHARSLQEWSGWAADAGIESVGIAAFLADLRKEGLLREEPALGGDEVEAAAPLLVELSAAGGRPEFSRFTDLQDLLLADPIHDAAPQGWPHLPPQNGSM